MVLYIASVVLFVTVYFHSVLSSVDLMPLTHVGGVDEVMVCPFPVTSLKVLPEP